MLCFTVSPLPEQIKRCESTQIVYVPYLLQPGLIGFRTGFYDNSSPDTFLMQMKRLIQFIRDLHIPELLILFRVLQGIIHGLKIRIQLRHLIIESPSVQLLPVRIYGGLFLLLPVIRKSFLHRILSDNGIINREIISGALGHLCGNTLFIAQIHHRAKGLPAITKGSLHRNIICGKAIRCPPETIGPHGLQRFSGLFPDLLIIFR